MKAFLIGLIVSSMVAGPVAAQCRARINYYTPPYVAQTYYPPAYAEPVKVVKEIAYQAIIPVFQLEVRRYNTYGAVYLPPVPDPSPASPGQSNPPTPAQSELRQILEAVTQISTGIKNLESRVKALEDRDKDKGVPKQKPKDPFNPDGEPKKEGAKLSIPDVNIVAQNNCAVCHDAKMGDDVAHNLVVTKGGKLAPLSDKDKTKTLVKLAKNKLCSGAAQRGLKPLTQEEYTAFVLALGKDD